VEKDYITERLKFLIEFFKLCWLSIFAVGGGMVSMFVVQGNPYRYPLVSAGGIVMLALLALLWHNHRKMQRLWAELRKGGAL